jgi:hypothetical protein
MKITLAIAVFAGLVSAKKRAEMPVWELKSVQDHRSDSQVQGAYGDHSTAAALARPPLRSHVQMD